MSYAYPPSVVDYSTRSVEARWEGHQKETREQKREKINRDRRRRRESLSKAHVVRPNLPTGRNHELFVVCGDDFRRCISPWMEKNMGLGGDADDSTVGAYDYLASEIGCGPDAIRKTYKTDRRWVPYTLAEAVILVIGWQHVFYNGELPLYANPVLARKTWIEKAREQDIEEPALTWFLHTHECKWATNNQQEAA